jgi:predicted secreted hydrolase
MRAALVISMWVGLAACSGEPNQVQPSTQSGPAAEAQPADGNRASDSNGATDASRSADGNRGNADASRSASANRAAALDPADASRLAALRASSLPQGFELVTAPKPFEFPRDHGPHPAFRHEWWYVTGHLDSPTGEPFGFELTFFRFALKPPAAPGSEIEGSSAWRARQIYMAHFAISDIGRKQFHVSERFARDALGLAGAQSEPFRVSLNDWYLGTSAEANRGAHTNPGADTNSGADTNPNPGDAIPAAGDAKSWRLVAADKGYSLDLEIDPSAHLMLNGDAGFSRKSDAEGAASFYYSIPRMAARGKLVRDGKALDVRGTVWLDREWGSGSLGADQQGWDWFALELDDGSALMFYALRKQDGQRDVHSAGTWLAPDGTARALASDDVQIESKGEWTSPRGGRYPARWQLRVPALKLDVDIQPRLADQELNTSTRYWEGASLVNGTRDGRAIRGKAYVELVGYATR